ncbi:hypothetical protein Gura_3248 [Geotalea uraniireducens Rf4]|uniref:Uncharacterized protein n=1 Tax=Geotalea uraniireducens (strain Rf4) TaxID=351605 RepID=A5G6J1_GEOUR|nr:hypothetical protein Gura_3248 [Geotalea uraniireducens Rf4]
MRDRWNIIIQIYVDAVRMICYKGHPVERDGLARKKKSWLMKKTVDRKKKIAYKVGLPRTGKKQGEARAEKSLKKVIDKVWMFC